MGGCSILWQELFCLDRFSTSRDTQPQRKLKLKLKAMLWISLLAIGAAPAFGQAPSLMLNVKKKEKTETKQRTTSSGYYSTYQYRSGVETLSYAVEIINAGGDVPNAKVSWAVVLRETGSGQLKVVEGTRTAELKRGQKFSFETDIIELGSFSRSNYYNSKSSNAELVGYLVEALVDGKVVASDAKPMDIRTKVQEARNAPKRHRVE
jgi:hypothetical protein